MAAPARKGLDTFQEQEQPAFLGVENSARGRRWLPRLNDAQQNAATALAQQHGLSLLQARVFVARGATADTLDDFLRPTIRNLMPDPLTLRDMDKGAARLAAAIRDSEPVAVFGDYDVDGAASASLMTLFLRHHGIEPRIYIPDRITEGYGPNTQAFTGLVEDGASLIVTVDCGTTAHEAVAAASALGADVVIVDHHLAGESLPRAEAVINPNRQDDLSQLGHLCAAGVTFMLLMATARLLREEGWYEEAGRRQCDLMELVDLVALATVCDVVPLTGLNRAFVRTGLARLHRRENRGLNALCDVSALAAAPSAYHLGFVLGPRINAGGRIGDSSLGVRLLTCSDDLEAAAIAQQLDRLNSERKAMEAAFLEDALAQADRMLAQSPDLPALLVHGDDWHQGVVGLVAARVCERFERPAIAIAWTRAGEGAGSARSVTGVDIGSVICEAREAGHLLKGGGHAMAAGLTLERGKLGDLRDFLEQRLSQPEGGGAGRARSLYLDGVLTPSAATSGLLAGLEDAGPFGSANPQPRFALAAHRVSYAKVVGDAHVRCTLRASDGSTIAAIAFRSADTELGRLLLASDGMPLHVAGHLRRNQWGGRESIEFTIDDAAPARTGGTSG